MIPRSKTHVEEVHTENVLGAHIVCNNFRGTSSLIGTMRLLGNSARRDPEAFSQWANSVQRGDRYKFTYPPNITRNELVQLFGEVRRLRNVAAMPNKGN